MNTAEQRAVLNIMVHAALADGRKSDVERTAVRDAAESLAGEGGAALAGVYQDVLLKRVTVADAAAALPSIEHRQLAYEMAVCVCDADGRMTEPERQFLARLAALLQLDSNVTAPLDKQAEDMAELAATAAPAAPTAPAAAGPVVGATTKSSEADQDRSVLNYAILNGALELLPQSWASMAVIPLQIKMVYGIGKEYGYELDQGHIRELLATLGVGLTSQYLEQFGRKLLGGLLGKVGGKMVGQFGRAATGVAFSFATTYALGQVARRYYAGGRQMNSALMQESFQNLLEPAKQMQARYLPQIQERAGSLDAGQIMALVRGT